MKRLAAVVLSLLGLPIFSPPVRAQSNLSSMSLEDLLNVEVTSVSKTGEKLSQTASAIYVISQEDIRGSGATNIPDLLRMVPGMDVGQINSNKWAVSARGFNAAFSKQLLVMVDGRTMYTPTFNGEWWDILDVPLEDIERIEVIRGPGGSVWGANAVNGVINIITRKAADTKGAMVVAGGGNLDQGFGTLQYGGEAGKVTNYRVYSRYFNQDHLPDLTGANGQDGWHLLRGGFRVDSEVTARDSLTFLGDLYGGNESFVTVFLPSITGSLIGGIPTEVNLSGGFLQAGWNHVYSVRSNTVLNVYYDRYRRDDVLMERRGTFAIDFVHHILWGGRQSVTWGLDYSDSASQTNGSLAFSFVSPNPNRQIFGSFAQDEIALVRDRLYLTVGTKLEHNDYTGFGLLPTIRAAWLPVSHQTFWTAVSRPLRAPSDADILSRADLGGSLPGTPAVIANPAGPPVAIAFLPNPGLTNEEALVYEMGYRTELNGRLSIDLAAYYNDYIRRESVEPLTPFFEMTPAPAHILVPLTFENLMHGEAHGFEVFGKWKVSDRFTLSPGYAFERIHMHLAPASQDTFSLGTAEGSNPVNSAQLRSHYSLNHGIAWDTSVYFVGRIANPAAPSYTRLDTGVTWQPGERLSFGVFGQNLLKDHRFEYADFKGVYASGLMKRGGYAKVTWRY